MSSGEHRHLNKQRGKFLQYVVGIETLAVLSGS